MKIREDAYAYFHGHEVGGTNPSLLEALASTDLNLLLGVGFNREVARDSALYWSKEPRRPGPPDRPGRRHGSGRDPRVGRQGQAAHRRRVQLAAHRDQYKNLFLNATQIAAVRRFVHETSSDSNGVGRNSSVVSSWRTSPRCSRWVMRFIARPMPTMPEPGNVVEFLETHDVVFHQVISPRTSLYPGEPLRRISSCGGSCMEPVSISCIAIPLSRAHCAASRAGACGGSVG